MKATTESEADVMKVFSGLIDAIDCTIEIMTYSRGLGDLMESVADRVQPLSEGGFYIMQDGLTTITKKATETRKALEAIREALEAQSTQNA